MKRLVPVVLTLVAVVASAIGVFTQRDRIEQMLGGAPPAAAAVTEVEPPVEFGQFAEMEGIVINPRDSNGRRYLMAKIGVEAESEKTLARLEELGPAARDAILTILASQSSQQLGDITRRDSLKQEVRGALNGLLGDDGSVSRIYFTQFVLQ